MAPSNFIEFNKPAKLRVPKGLAWLTMVGKKITTGD